MYLKHLSLLNFKNYAQAELNFGPKLNFFVGNNGVGKTNLLDAIHYLSFCKSYFNPVDSQNISHDQSFFVIHGFFESNNEQEEVYCGIKRNHKKQFKRNKKEYERLSDHIGFYPLVMISPSDSELIMGSSELRRKFVDSIISQYNRAYLDKLISYNHALSQRNALLKYFGNTHVFDQESLDLWDEQLVLFGEQIMKERLQFIEEMLPLFNANYRLISKDKENVGLSYDPSIGNKDYKTALITNLKKDRALEYTGIGVHRDDILLTVNGYDLRKYASQGQQKSYLLALKLAQFTHIAQLKKQKPMLLLDDIYDKLDKERFHQLIKQVSGDEFGQVFLTDTHMDRIMDLLREESLDAKVFSVEMGHIKELTYA